MDDRSYIGRRDTLIRDRASALLLGKKGALSVQIAGSGASRAPDDLL